MSEDQSETVEDSVERLRRLADCCDRFELACTEGRSPRPDDYRSEVPATEWPAVRVELELLRRTYDAAGERETTAPVNEEPRPSSGDETDSWSGRGRMAALERGRGPGANFGQLPIGTKVGCYEILSRIGAGGMGVVYRARQLTPKIDRQVALKLIRLDLVPTRGGGAVDEALHRFTTETLAAGRLAHEHIVPVFEVGEWQGRPFYTMFLVEGPSLSVLLREGPLSNERAAMVLEPVARAVAQAHAGQIIHRDLKPSNILLDANQRPYVTDFGLAKLLERSEPLTRAGQILGTVSYMSPEQASDPSSVREPGDIYSLGTTLYEMLTGRPPFRAAEPSETMRQVKFDPPAPPRRLNPAISRDLETICLKCLEKEPARRYPSALELADELGRFLRNEPIRARPISPMGRTLRWVRGHPAIAALLVAIVLVASAGFFSTTLQLRQTRLALVALERRSYFDEIDLAAQAIAANKFEVAEQQLARTSPSLRGWEYHYLNHLASSGRAISPEPFPVQAGGLYGVAFHPEGRWFATGGRLARLRIWDPGGSQPPVDLPEIPSGAYVDDIKWVKGPRSNHLAAGTRDGTVHLWDESEGRFSGYRTATHHEGAVTQLSFHPDGTRLASAGEDGRVLIVDVADGEKLLMVCDLETPIRSVAYHPGGEWLAFAGDDHEISLWDASGRGRVRRLGTVGESIGALAFSQDGRHLAAGDNSGTIRIWDLSAENPPVILSASFEGINALAFTPDGSRLASAGADGMVKIWDFAAGREVLKLAGHTDQADALCFRPDGLQLLSVDVDGRLMIWDATRWEQPPPPRPVDLRGHTKLIVALAVSPVGDRLATGGIDDEILVWNVRERSVTARLRGHRGRVNGLSIDSTGRWLASASRDETLRIWDLATARECSRYTSQPGDRLSSVAFSPRERRVAFAGTRGRVFAWDCDPSHGPSPLGEHPDEVYAIAYHPDGQSVAAAGAEGVIRRWNAIQGGLVDEFREHLKAIDGLAFSPDGQLLASVSHDRTLHIRDLATGVSRTLGGHDSRIWRVAFSGDSRRLASASGDGSVRVWDVATGRPMALLGHSSRVYGVAFDPLGRFLASVSGDSLVKLWDSKAWDLAPQ
jgi:eukaryotic-like serine/threonine-protein kinase